MNLDVGDLPEFFEIVALPVRERFEVQVFQLLLQALHRRVQVDRDDDRESFRGELSAARERLGRGGRRTREARGARDAQGGAETVAGRNGLEVEFGPARVLALPHEAKLVVDLGDPGIRAVEGLFFLGLAADPEADLDRAVVDDLDAAREHVRQGEGREFFELDAGDARFSPNLVGPGIDPVFEIQGFRQLAHLRRGRRLAVELQQEGPHFGDLHHLLDDFGEAVRPLGVTHREEVRETVPEGPVDGFVVRDLGQNRPLPDRAGAEGELAFPLGGPGAVTLKS